MKQFFDIVEDKKPAGQEKESTKMAGKTLTLKELCNVGFGGVDDCIRKQLLTDAQALNWLIGHWRLDGEHFDSISVIEMEMAIEAEYEIEIPPEDMVKVVDLQGLLDLVNGLR